jgi:hypothetical protein
MYSASGPSPHGKIEEIPKLHRTLLAQHVMVLVHVNDELGRSDNPFLDQCRPPQVSLMVMFHDKINWPGSPFKELVQLMDGPCHQPEIVQINVQNN